ncbi:inorganic phosphate transporter [Thioclava sp. SK-1]|uniref:inorganic phosphate transporter n=1 Tax=Thioclava sp. SK-1 TaxID=1889770 RepID=UPI000826C63E|nr:inorganic phosphate transporter [Thioclava sp. SK-1]OCX59849.1 inorganic phosphate transporter [Thioclava sp. SK-1]
MVEGPDGTPVNQWKTLDKDLQRIGRVEDGAQFVSRPMVAPGLALAFVVLAGVGAAILVQGEPGNWVIVAAAVIGAYMALNIGANDVANNMGPAVGAKALPLLGALCIAAIFESAGALVAGGDVVNTVAKGIIDPTALPDPAHFVWAMMAALLSAALWLNLATWFGAPVSTTHSIVGGVVGAGIVAAGFGAIDWSSMGMIAASWVISPMMGGVIAACFLAFIKAKVLYVEDKIAAARVWVPVLMGVMAGAFATYLALKGLKHVLQIGLVSALGIGGMVGILCWAFAVPFVRLKSKGLENRKKSLKKLFGLPLVVSAALLSFAHGANDVANAVGPLAAIVHTLQAGAIAQEVSLPIWVLTVGALGISVGLLLFGPRLIRLVGSEITKLNTVRAFCVALSAAITVIFASWLGLPVSSTHIAVGGIFGVGFYREYDAEKRARRLGIQKGKPVPPEERKRRLLVRRSHMMTVAAAWVVTVPASAGLSAVIYLVLDALT